jgi:thiamine biosynthesis lipoprotein
VVDAGIATSGRYERGDHVLDPRTGNPVTGLASVTVVGPDLGLADAYATALMVMGAVDGLEWLRTRAPYEAMAITDDQEVLMTSGFDARRIS